MDLSLLRSLFPYSVWDCWWLAPVALLLDLRLGDPALPWPHPVCFAGRLLGRLEGPARRWMRRGDAAGEKRRGRLAGLVCLFLLTGVSGLAVWLLISLPLLGVLSAVYLAWAGLAMGSLLDTGREVLRRVETYPEPEAREALSWLVSRDTGRMDRPLMRKTLADTLSENFTDALLAPFFWLLLAGPVGLWMYKAVSTTDSMWGYLTEPLALAGLGRGPRRRLPGLHSRAPFRGGFTADGCSAALSEARGADLGRFMAGLTAGGPAGGGHAQPQFRLVHDRLRLALPGAHGRAFGLFRRTGGQALAGTVA